MVRTTFKQEDQNNRDEIFGRSTESKTVDRGNAASIAAEVERLSPEQRKALLNKLNEKEKDRDKEEDKLTIRKREW